MTKISAKDVNKTIKAAMKTKKLVIGTHAVIRGIKTGVLHSVLYVSNSPEHLKRDMSHYAQLSKTNIKEAAITSAELGELCGKPFTILVAGIKK